MQAATLDLVNLTKDLQQNERIMVSLAVKYQYEKLRIAHDELKMEYNKELEQNQEFSGITKMFLENVNAEIKRLCEKFILFLQNYLVDHPGNSSEGKAHYMKLIADYYRYLVEVELGTDQKDAKEVALNAYRSAINHANSKLAPSNPYRLGIALNMSVFYEENLNNHDLAFNLSKAAYDDAIAELDDLDELAQSETALVLKQLKQFICRPIFN
ncbi:14-3-3-like protein GF14-A [Cichlidogyrus casuarinus]|uniref:14-3-3-like protein GF14-A n=1 Tax=Cichlidogyrus casuarinus TaxID=1844966 RepID=A0ABD2Q5Z4_9PLAT